MLLILTLSLAVFTASMAHTLDRYTVERTYYEVGADFRLVEIGESTEEAGFGVPGNASSRPSEQEDSGPEWLFLPVSEHLTIPEIDQAARVWTRGVKVKLGGQNLEASLVGVDRVDFAQTTFFRRDFAPASLGALMNALAIRDDGVLVSRELWESGLEVGDVLPVSIPAGLAPEVGFRVAGVVDLFPRQYPEDGPFLVGNLDFIFNSIGGMYPYDVWVKTGSRVDTERLVDQVESLGISVMKAYNAREAIDREQFQPERQGVFGLLSVGFVASAFLTVLGFLIYSYVSFSQRYIELGVLRAVGLSVRQMAVFLFTEQLTLIVTGALVGTGLGVLVSRLFIPFFQVQGGKHPFTPPFVVQVAWTEILYVYAIFGMMLLAAASVLMISLRRMRVFEAVKLGETT